MKNLVNIVVETRVGISRKEWVQITDRFGSQIVLSLHESRTVRSLLAKAEMELKYPGIKEPQNDDTPFQL